MNIFNKYTLVVATTGGLIFPGILIAQQTPKTVKVQVQVTTSQDAKVSAVGFSVGNKKTGGLGKLTTKSGPTGKYSFGIRTKNGDLSCGSATISQDSIVKLSYDGKTCKVTKIVPMKK